MNTQKLPLLTVLLAALLVLAACAQEAPALPTAVATAVVPTDPPPTPTPLPPTQDLTILTRTPEPTSTRPPTPTPPPVDAFITITEPDPEDTLVLGSEVEVRGIADLNEGDVIGLSLYSLNGRLLADVPGERNEAGWLARLTVPEFVSGVGRLEASVRTPEGDVLAAYELPVLLETDLETAVRYLDLYRPEIDDTAVAGFGFVFDGRTLRPVGGSITISIWNEACTNRVLNETYPLGGGGYWQGFMVLPPDAVGPACAIAAFGREGDSGWREVQVPITLLSPEDENAGGVIIANPIADSTWTPGDTVFINGIAFGAIVQPVSVEVLLENGRVIAQETPETDYWGYWEMSVTLPAEIEGPARVTAIYGTLGEPGYGAAEAIVEIVPAEEEGGG